MIGIASKPASQNRCLLSLLQTQKWSVVLIVTIVWLGFFTDFSAVIAQTNQNSSAVVQPRQSTQWLTGAKLDRFNQTTLSVSWSEAKIRSRLKNYASIKKSAIFLDRRVDPTLSVTLSLKGVCPEQFLWSVAESQQIGICRLDDVYYFGPQEATASLPTLWQAMKQETSKQKKRHKVDWSKRSQLETEAIVEPLQLLNKLAAKHNFKIINLEEIPHDIWLGFELPSMSIDGQLGIILAGFGKWFERSADGRSVKIIDFKEVKSAKLEVKRTKNFPDPRKLTKSLKANHPSLKIRATGQRLSATGPPLNIAKLRSDLVKLQVTEKIDLSLIRYDVTNSATRITFLNTVAMQANMQLKFDPKLNEKLSENVTVSLKQATLNDLLIAALNGTNLKHKMTETEILVYE